MTDEPLTLDQLVGGIGRLYTNAGCSPPVELRRAAQGWTGIPLEKLVAVIEAHLDRHRQLYRGAGDRFFPLLQSEIEQLLDEHGLGASHGVANLEDRERRPARSKRGVRRVFNGIGFDAVDERDASEADVSGLHAPQPYISPPRREYVNVAGLPEDDWPEDNT